MKQGYRRDRLQSEIIKETSQILLYEMRDPRSKGMVTVVKVKVSADYRHARIYVSVMGTPKEKKLTMAGLHHAQGFVQRALSRRIQMRIFPEIAFELDESIEKAFQVTRLIDEATGKTPLRSEGEKE